MANPQFFKAKDYAEQKRDMCMSSLKRALDDVENTACEEPTTKKFRLHTTRKRSEVSTTYKRAGRTTNKNQLGKKLVQRVPGGQHKTRKSTNMNKRKISKRSVDSLTNYMEDEVNTKKIKLEREMESNESQDFPNAADGEKTADEVNIAEDEKTADEVEIAEGEKTADEAKIAEKAEATDEVKVADEISTEVGLATAQQGESAKSEQQTSGTSQHDRAKEFNLAQLPYSLRKNVAFSRKVLVYSSDGSEYDYNSDDSCDICMDRYDDESDLSDDDDADSYDEFDPDTEDLSERLNLEIQSYLSSHKNRDENTDPTTQHVGETSAGESIGITLQLMGDPSTSGIRIHSTFNFGRPAKAPQQSEPAAADVELEAEIDHDENGNDSEEIDRAKSAYTKSLND